MTKMWAAWLSIAVSCAAPSFAWAQETNRQERAPETGKSTENLKTKSVAEDGEDIDRKPASPVKQEALPEPGTALWKMADEDTTIYLLGTVHIFPHGTRWQNDAIREAIELSEELVVETRTDMSMTKFIGAIAVRAFDASQPPLLDRVPVERHEEIESRLTAIIEKMGLSRSFFDKLDTWAVASMLDEMSETEEEDIFYSGAEDELEEQFEISEKPIGELETWQSQLDIFDKISQEAQLNWLYLSLDDTWDFDSPANLVDIWTSGDVAEINLSNDITGPHAEEILDALLYRRNRNWVEWLIARLDEPGTILVAVGAGHLAGPNSVQDYLEAVGVEVTRIR